MTDALPISDLDSIVPEQGKRVGTTAKGRL